MKRIPCFPFGKRLVPAYQMKTSAPQKVTVNPANEKTDQNSVFFFKQNGFIEDKPNSKEEEKEKAYDDNIACSQ